MARKLCVGTTITNGLVQAVVFDTLAYADLPLPALPNDATQFLNGLGAFSVPAGSGGSLTSAIALASADTSVGVASWTDATGCSISCVAGTWLFLAGAQGRNNGSTSTCGAKIYYGSTDLCSCEAAIVSTSANLPFSLFTIAVLAGTQTVKLAGNSDGGTMVFKRYGDYDMGAANIPGTYLVAVKLG